MLGRWLDHAGDYDAAAHVDQALRYVRQRLRPHEGQRLFTNVTRIELAQETNGDGIKFSVASSRLSAHSTTVSCRRCSRSAGNTRP